ncbi:MAG: glycosyltransferase family 4 protein, partial [Desulfovermiculus sp.]
MHLLAILFLAALLGTLVLTPVAAKIGYVFGAIDQPGARKIHTSARPRTGGIALFASFVLLLGLAALTPLFQPWFVINQGFFFTMAGLSLAFAAGLIDDFHNLHCLTKLGLQIVSASLAFFGGLHIDHFYLPGVHLEFNPLLSFGLTLFWFLLFINAVNLIDGLDGLAGGIVFFAASTMTILLAWRGDMANAAWFALIAGCCLGFLRSNFHPASVFLGDGGSYFLGYAMAAFSIMANFKSQVGASLLIPIIGLGVPMMDTLISPIRRFLMGKGVFSPDSDHIHHRLLHKGLSTHQAIWILYGITVVLCLFALYLVQLRDSRGILLLLVMGSGYMLFMYKLGYFKQFGNGNFSTWMQDVCYEMGLAQDRRSFVNLQLAICDSHDFPALWDNTVQALEQFEFDLGEMVLYNGSNSDHPDLRFTWTKNGQDYTQIINSAGSMKLEMPLITRDNRVLGMLWLIKDMHNTNLSHYTLRRVEHLRRSVLKTVEGLHKQSLPLTHREGKNNAASAAGGVGT